MVRVPTAWQKRPQQHQACFLLCAWPPRPAARPTARPSAPPQSSPSSRASPPPSRPHSGGSAPGDARLESRHAESRRGSARGRDAHQPSRVVPSRQALPFTRLCVLVARPANEPPQAGEPMCNKKPPEDEREETELDAALQAVELLHNTAQPVRTSDGRQHTPSAARRVRTRDTTRRRAPKGVLACRGSEDE